MRLTEADREAVMERVIANVEVDEATGCWNWQRYVDPMNGYGYFGVKGRSRSVHRSVYLVHGGDPELMATHECNNNRCCNPEHLVPGTARKNRQDAVRRGTSKRSGCRPAAEMAPIREEVKRLSAAGVTVVEIARRLGVSTNMVIYQRAKYRRGVTNRDNGARERQREGATR
jgi:hypothetical protein